jgi:hypothetical protein
MKADREKMVLVEAEDFEELGGWVLDQQFMDVMGSPFLLAHGLGEPVDDARTAVHLPGPGEYRVWVRTRDWVAPWDAPGAPGRFRLIVDGTPLETTFGTEGAEWHWQDGGTVNLDESAVEVTSWRHCAINCWRRRSRRTWARSTWWSAGPASRASVPR